MTLAPEIRTLRPGVVSMPARSARVIPSKGNSALSLPAGLLVNLPTWADLPQREKIAWGLCVQKGGTVPTEINGLAYCPVCGGDWDNLQREGFTPVELDVSCHVPMCTQCVHRLLASTLEPVPLGFDEFAQALGRLNSGPVCIQCRQPLDRSKLSDQGIDKELLASVYDVDRSRDYYRLQDGTWAVIPHNPFCGQVAGAPRIDTAQFIRDFLQHRYFGALGKACAGVLAEYDEYLSAVQQAVRDNPNQTPMAVERWKADLRAILYDLHHYFVAFEEIAKRSADITVPDDDKYVSDLLGRAHSLYQPGTRAEPTEGELSQQVATFRVPALDGFEEAMGERSEWPGLVEDVDHVNNIFANVEAALRRIDATTPQDVAVKTADAVTQMLREPRRGVADRLKALAEWGRTAATVAASYQAAVGQIWTMLSFDQ
ncbi:hypothetical protein [Lentzea sp. E54]|uniref:hypothetical protein n=1 Tax=Lentzea xerophila TaxID=3435883 RepID=UPI003DA39866